MQRKALNHALDDACSRWGVRVQALPPDREERQNLADDDVEKGKAVVSERFGVLVGNGDIFLARRFAGSLRCDNPEEPSCFWANSWSTSAS